MTAKAGAFLIIRIIVLVILFFICYSAAFGLLIPSTGVGPQTPAEVAATFAAMVVICVLNTVILAWIIIRSRWSGWRLVLTIFFVLYGTATFMTQIETAVFVTRLPQGMLSRLFLAGAVYSAVFSPLAVLVLGKFRTAAVSEPANTRLVMPAKEWLWKLFVIAVCYVVIYFTFGYYIAWRTPAVQQYYGGTDPGSFLTQIGSVISQTPWLPFFQMLRALIWVALAAPVIRMMKGDRWEAALAVALIFSVVVCSQLLLPNTLMPTSVRMAHLLETSTSNFLFGLLVVWLLTSRTAEVQRVDGVEQLGSAG